MPICILAKSNKWRPLALCLAMILINPPMISAGANQTETPGPWIVTKALGLDVPLQLEQLADEVIE